MLRSRNSLTLMPMSRHDFWRIVLLGRLNSLNRRHRCRYGRLFLCCIRWMEDRKSVRLSQSIFWRDCRYIGPRDIKDVRREWRRGRASNDFDQNKWAEAHKAKSRKPNGARHDPDPPDLPWKLDLKRGKKRAAQPEHTLDYAVGGRPIGGRLDYWEAVSEDSARQCCRKSMRSRGSTLAWSAL